MKKLVQLVLLLVMSISLTYAALELYMLVYLWGAKLEIGVAQRDLLKALSALVLGVGLPYCMILYIKSKT